jgi:hypothetical protein
MTRRCLLRIAEDVNVRWARTDRVRVLGEWVIMVAGRVAWLYGFVFAEKDARFGRPNLSDGPQVGGLLSHSQTYGCQLAALLSFSRSTRDSDCAIVDRDAICKGSLALVSHNKDQVFGYCGRDTGREWLKRVFACVPGVCEISFSSHRG